MVFGVVLGGGIGTRMGADKPKQYISIGNKPVIIHTIEKFVASPDIDHVVVLCPEQWVEHTRNICRRYLGPGNKVDVIRGGGVRNETIMNAIRFIEEEYDTDEDTVIVTHDAVRPFLTYRIIEDNVRAAKEFGACDTVIPATDTIVESMDNDTISLIPDRTKLYQGQTPQSFKMKELRRTYESLSEDEKRILTDAAKIYSVKGKTVKLVKGEPFNIKLTYPYDLTVAETLLQGGK